MSSDEIARYRRNIALAQFGEGAQAALKRGRALVIGAGGLGCPALLYLAAAGAGRITIMDAERVEVSNLQRQVLFTTADAAAGAQKAVAAARRLRELNPLVEVEGRVGRFSRDNGDALAAAHDVVVDASDNFETRYLADDACARAGTPLVQGTIRGYEGRVSVFNWRGGPAYRDLFPQPVAEAGDDGAPGVLGAVCGVAGAAMAAEAVKLLTGLGEPLSGRVWIWDALAASGRILKLRPGPARPGAVRFEST